MQLAKDLKARVYWLRGTPHQWIMPALDRFAKAGWGAADIVRELDRTLARRGWEVPSGRVSITRAGREHRYRLRCPWGYLAMLLRTLEPADLVAEREHARTIRTVQLRYDELRRTGPECPTANPPATFPRRSKVSWPARCADGRSRHTSRSDPDTPIKASLPTSYDDDTRIREVADMRTTVNIDDELLARAGEMAGIAERTALLNEGLRRIIQQESARRLAALGGSDPDAKAAPRRKSA